MKLIIALVMVVGPTSTVLAQEIGNATSVRPQAHVNSQMMATGHAVHARDLVHTDDGGRADMRFHDNSNFSVGPKSSVVLDKFVYDPNKSTGSVVINATKGSFRFTTGGQGKSQIKTPWGTLGIRG